MNVRYSPMVVEKLASVNLDLTTIKFVEALVDAVKRNEDMEGGFSRICAYKVLHDVGYTLMAAKLLFNEVYDHGRRNFVDENGYRL